LKVRGACKLMPKGRNRRRTRVRGGKKLPTTGRNTRENAKESLRAPEVNNGGGGKQPVLHEKGRRSPIRSVTT